MADNRKPLVDANLVTEFGGIEDLESFKAEGIARQDRMYVPGFSEMRVEREMALQQYHKHEIKAQDVPVLGWNCRWYRCSEPKSGNPDESRSVGARNEGYRAATKADEGQPWMRSIPPGGYVAPDGTIRNSGGDLILFVCDGQNAARNAMKKKIRTEEMVDGMDMNVNGLGVVGKAHKGANPTIEKIGGSIK